MRAIQRQSGLEQFMGSIALAAVMGTGNDVAESVEQTSSAWICSRCAEQANILEKILRGEPEKVYKGQLR